MFHSCESLSNCNLAQLGLDDNDEMFSCESLSNCNLAQLTLAQYLKEWGCESLSNCNLAQHITTQEWSTQVVNRFQIVI